MGGTRSVSPHPPFPFDAGEEGDTWKRKSESGVVGSAPPSFSSAAIKCKLERRRNSHRLTSSSPPIHRREGNPTTFNFQQGDPALIGTFYSK